MDEDDLLTDAEDAPRGRADSIDDSKLKPGTDVAGYVVDEEIGKGGMGHVYSATHRMIGKRAAIKVLKPDVSRSPIVVERFIQEARAVNQIHHPNIIDIFAFGALEDGRAYHIMDLLIGESLRKRLKRGPLHPSEAASVLEETASALVAAHDKGFIHRDLKPDNIFLQTRDGRWPEVKLLDFGLAKLMPEAAGAGFTPFRTKTGVMLGTPEYMSPEQARGTGVDYRTDIYALGVMMFEILAGRRPFISMGDAFATLMMHAEEPPPSLADFVPDLPPEMVQLVDTMLAKDPAGRPSLPAIRAVVKRIRTSKLPGHTMALELSLQKPAPLAKEPELGIDSFALGAAAVLPGESNVPPDPMTPEERRKSRPQPAAQRSPSVPPINRAASPVALEPPEQRPSGLAMPTAGPNAKTRLSEPAIQLPPPPSMPQVVSPNSPSMPPTPVSSILPPTERGQGKSLPPTPLAQLPGSGSLPPTSLASIHGSHPGTHSLPPQSLKPPAMSTHGARPHQSNAGIPLPSTHGSAPPQRDSAPSITLPDAVAPQGAPPEKHSRVWILVGALGAIAIGIVIALIVVGT